MNNIDIINNILKTVFINIFTYLVITKLINYKENNVVKIIGIILFSCIESCAEVFFINVPAIVRLISVYSIYGVIISKITKHKLGYSIIISLLSLSITYTIYIISIVITGVLTKLINLNVQKDNTIILILVLLIEYLIIYVFFKQKRFKNGITFLKDEKRINGIGIFGVVLSGTALILYSILRNNSDNQTTNYLLFGILIEAICLFIWIKKKITKYYKQKLKEQTVADLQNEIKEKDNKINEILEENKAIATINHKYSSRIKALEEFSSKVVSKPELVEKMKTEFGEDYTAFAAQIKRISQEYSNEMKTKVTKENAIPKTGIFGIDTLLEHMSTEATKSNISLDVKINASLNYMVENIISESALETLLGDHIKDAIIAINCSNNTNRRILVVISIVDRCYEINFYDTGIEFEIDTLIKLGKEQITTHKETGRKRNRLYDHIWDIKQNKGKLNYRRKVPNE